MENRDKLLEAPNELIVAVESMNNNLVKVNALNTVLRALALGVSVKIGDKYLAMIQGRLFVKGLSCRDGVCHVQYLSYDLHFSSLLNSICEEQDKNPEWLEGVKAQADLVYNLNKSKGLEG